MGMHLLEDQQKLMILNKTDQCKSYLYDLSTSELESIPFPTTYCKFSVFCCGSKVILITRELPTRFLYFDLKQKIWKHTELGILAGYVKNIWFDEDKCALLAIISNIYETDKKNKIKMLRVNRDILTPRDI